MAGCSTVAKALRPRDSRRRRRAGDRATTRGARSPPASASTAACRGRSPTGCRRPSPGELTFEVNRQRVDEIVTVSDAEILDAMAFLFDRLKIVTEPSGAIGVAALLAGRIECAGGARRRDRLRRQRRRRALRRAARPRLDGRGAGRDEACADDVHQRALRRLDRSRRRRGSGRAPSRSALPRCRRRRRCPRGDSRSRRGTLPVCWPRAMIRWIASIGFTSSPMRCWISALRAISRTSTRVTSGCTRQPPSRRCRDTLELLACGLVRRLDLVDLREQVAPRLAEDRVEHLVLRGEVVVEQSVRDARLLGDVTDARGVEALVREHPDGRVENETPFLLRSCRTLDQGGRTGTGSFGPHATASRGDARRRPHAATCREPLRRPSCCGSAPASCGSSSPAATRCATRPPAGIDALNAGKESVVCDLPDEAPFLRGLLGRADVVLDTFRPGVLARLGVRPQDVPAGVVACSITGFGDGGRHEQRAGHDLNYQGWAGVLHDTAPAWPPVQIADLAAGSLGAVTEILAALLARERTGAGARLTISMTHGTHRLASFRLGGDPRPRLLTGGLACYRTYATARRPPPHRRRARAEVLPPPLRADRPARARRIANTTDDQDALAARARSVSSRRRRSNTGSRVFDNDDVCVGPVATLEEAAADLGTHGAGPRSRRSASTPSAGARSSSV